MEIEKKRLKYMLHIYTLHIGVPAKHEWDATTQPFELTNNMPDDGLIEPTNEFPMFKSRWLIFG